jgi:3-methyl-2-oxobutanoate hydroxymethyltransferase
MNIFDFQLKKINREKISMVTCYDYTSARMIANTSVDCLLVGDSVAMTMHGFKDTIAATLDMMCMHTSAVARGAPNKFIVTDLPFLSYRKSLRQSVAATEALMKAGAKAIKLEGALGNEKFIRHITESGVPVMGHLGLTPQLIHILGGHKIQGKTKESQAQLKKDALSLQDAGCFALVLECVPSDIALEISQALSIPTIGIGAGPGTDGQVLVFQDLLGMNIDFKPRFVKNFMNAYQHISDSIESYVKELKAGDFPLHEHSYES